MAENFDLIFGQNASQQYAWSDNDYQNGWETIGSIPPTAAQFDALQRRADMKSQELNNNLTPLVEQNTANNRQSLTTYALKDIRYSPLLPTGWFLECSTAGTTDSAEITLPSPLVENAVITDGTCVWKVRKIGSGGGEAVGVIKAFAGNGDIPSGYLLCDGSAVSRTMFPDLFSAIGTTYGAGDGSTTFNLPDYNTAQRFAQGATVAGIEKEAGLPNIEGNIGRNTKILLWGTDGWEITDGAFANSASETAYSGGANTGSRGSINFDASQSNSIYGNSDTVQPNALTCRYIIKAFDGQTADSALIDITQYAQELAGKANITGSNLVHHRDVITTSGTYTAPVTGLYKITVKGGGGGGAGGRYSSSTGTAGGGGGEGGTTIAYERLEVGDTVTVVVGAGGTAGASSSGSAVGVGTNGGDSTVTVNSNTYTGGGGSRGGGAGGAGGSGTIPGMPGGASTNTDGSSVYAWGSSGGGFGGGVGEGPRLAANAGINGGGGAGGGASGAASAAGGAGGNGYVWFEYYTPGA